MHLIFVLSICLVNSIVFCIDTSSTSTPSSSVVSTTTQSTSLFSSETASRSSSTTYRPHYPDTYSPGSIFGITLASFVFIVLITMSSYYIRSRRIYYLPYYNNYRPI